MLHLQMIGFRAQGCARAVADCKQNDGWLRHRECGASSRLGSAADVTDEMGVSGFGEIGRR
jgi:hypothetical protein